MSRSWTVSDTLRGKESRHQSQSRESMRPRPRGEVTIKFYRHYRQRRILISNDLLRTGSEALKLILFYCTQAWHDRRFIYSSTTCVPVRRPGGPLPTPT